MISTLGNISMKTDYAEMVRRSLEPEHSVLIAVDIQEKLLPPIFEKDRLVKNSQLLIRLAGNVDEIRRAAEPRRRVFRKRFVT